MHDSTQPGCFPSTAIWSDPFTSELSLPLGKWHVMANGRIYHLNITAISGVDVTGDIGEHSIVGGKWDASAGMLTFTRVVPDTLRQNFTGYLMAYAPEDDKWRMAGVFQHDPDEKGFGPAGWYATQPRGE